jgi:hypothetical protein
MKKFNMQDCKPTKVPILVGARLTVEQCPKTHEGIEDMEHVPYASVVGNMVYAIVCTRPNIAHAVGVLRRYMLTPRKENCTTVKRVFMYLCGTKDYAICYQGRPGCDNGKLDVHGYVDADWAGDMDQRRSTSGYVFQMFFGATSWMRKRQVVIALSTTKIKYMAATHGKKKVVCL